MYKITLNHKAAAALCISHRSSAPRGEEFFAAAKMEERFKALVQISTAGKLTVTASEVWEERLEDASFHYLARALSSATTSNIFSGEAAPMVVAAIEAINAAVVEVAVAEADAPVTQVT
jgi:hypothetical protein